MSKESNDKRELLKLKQGIIEKSDSIDESGYDVKMPTTAKEKTKNWMWYHIGLILLGILIAALMIVVYFMFFKADKPDIRVYSVNNYSGTTLNMLSDSMKNYCPDYDNNGEHVVNINQPVMDNVLSNIDVYEEINSGNSDIFIGTKEQLTSLYEDILEAKGNELFADLSAIEGAEGYLLSINDTVYGKNMQIFTTEIYFAVRNTGDENAENAIEFLGNLQSGKQFTKGE